MKKLLSLLLVLLLCVGVFAACNQTGNNGGNETTTGTETGTQTEGPTLEDALAFIQTKYKADEGKKTTNNFELIPKIPVNGVYFDVTWTVDNAAITIALNSDGYWEVQLPTVNETETIYTLTATIKDAAGKTVTYKTTRTLPVISKVSGVVNELEENTAYKAFFKQANIGKTLFLLSETSNNKFIKATTDPKAAPDFFAEKVEGGYKFYVMVNGVKTYMKASTETTTAEDGTSKTSKFLAYDAEGSVFTYKKEINAWVITIDKVEYAIGTYNTYDTASLSESSHYTSENTGVTQFPIEFILKADGEAMAPTTGPADPTELTSIADVLAIAAKKDHNTYTVEKYLVKGVITEIANATFGNLYISDDAGNTIYIYGLWNNDGSVRFDKMDPQPKVGDTITVMSIVGQYNDTPQLKNAWVTKLDAVVCEHTYSADCDANCDKCGTTREAAAHTYDNACDAECNVCKATRTPAAHDYDNDCDAECNVCKATRKVADHVYDNACDAKCNVCDAERTVPAHVYDNACDADCNVCKATRTPAAHVYDNDCDKDCNVCKTTRPVECVDANTDGKCDKCGADMPNKADIEKSHIAHEKGKITFADVTEETTVTLVVAGKDYTDVTISWTATGATIADGKVTFTPAETEQTVVLTATFKCGDTTITATYTVKVAALPPVDDSFLKENTAYKFGMFQEKAGGYYYLVGGMDGFYLATTNTFASGLDVYVEKTDGGYYLYCMVEGVKNYINCVVTTGTDGKTHVNGAYETTASTVYTYNEEKNTLVTMVTVGDAEPTEYWLGTRNDKSYTTVGPCAVSYNGFFCQLYLASGSAPEAPTPENPGTTPENPGTTPENPGTTPENPGTTPENPGTTPENPGTSVPAGDKLELTVDSLGIPSQKYLDGTATVDGVTFEFTQMGNYGNGIQMRDKADKGTSIIWNTTAFNRPIARIELVYNGAKDTYDNPDAVIFTFGNAMAEATYTTKLSTTAGVKTYTITPDAETYTFFKLEHDYGYSMYWDSITIVFAD